MILRLLGNETIQFSTRGKKSELDLRKQLSIDVKSTTKFNFFFKYINIFVFYTNIRHFRFSISYYYLQALLLCVTTFYKTAFYYNIFRRRLNSRNIKRLKFLIFCIMNASFPQNPINYQNSFLLCGL